MQRAFERAFADDAEVLVPHVVDARSSPTVLTSAWVDGETFDVTPWQGTQFLILALVNYCRQNTEMPFHQAVAFLGQSLKADRLGARSDLVPVEQDGRRMLVYVEVVRRVQQRLKDNGFAIGAVDGQYGPNTAAALKEFQVTQGLEPTGLPDQVTLNQLFYAAAGGAN